MNIAYVLPEFVTEKEAGGLATYYDNIARLMADAGNNVTIFVLSTTTENVDYYTGIKVKRVYIDTGIVDPSIPGSFIRLWSKEINRAVEQYINEGNHIDIIQYPNFMGLGFDRIESIPTIVRVSSYRPLLRAADLEEFNINMEYVSIKAPDFIEEISVIKADNVYSPSELSSKFIQKETGRDINIIESPFYPRKISGSLQLPEILKGKKYIITFGTLKALKGAKVIGDSIFEILNRNLDLYWVFAGAEVPWKDLNGGMISPSQYISTNAGVYDDRVLFLGKLEQDKLLQIVHGAKLCVMPSRVDNLPNTCIEAMALGKVVIGTTGASFEQLIEDGKNGFLVERENKDELIRVVCKALALNDEELLRMGEGAKDRIKKMSPEKVRDQLLNLYIETISRCGNNDYRKNIHFSTLTEKYNCLLKQTNNKEAEQFIII